MTVRTFEEAMRSPKQQRIDLQALSHGQRDRLCEHYCEAVAVQTNINDTLLEKLKAIREGVPPDVGALIAEWLNAINLVTDMSNAIVRQIIENPTKQ